MPNPSLQQAAAQVVIHRGSAHGGRCRVRRSAPEGSAMSVDLIVYLHPSAGRKLSAWQQAIRATGLPDELVHNFDPGTFSGFLP